MSLVRLIRRGVVFGALAVSSLGLAAGKTLITYEGGKAGPAIAKSWKKGKGNYTFVLDMTSDIGQGSKSLPEVVKSSLESKLGASNGVKVTAKGKDSVVVAYTGDEKAFLEAVSQTRIRSAQNIEIAAESTVSQGGVRAKTSEREPVDGEVKGSIVSTKADVVVVRVITASPKSKALGIKDGEKVEVKVVNYTGKKGEVVFFTPTAKEGAAWGASTVTAK